MFERVCSELPSLPFDWIGLCGRDPLQARAARRILEIALNTRLQVRVYSGFLAQSLVPEKVRGNLSRLDLTWIVWGRKTVHDHVCGVRNAFADAIMRLAEWQKAGARVAAKLYPRRESLPDIECLRAELRSRNIPLFVSTWWQPFDLSMTSTGCDPLPPTDICRIAGNEGTLALAPHASATPPCKAGRQRAFITASFKLKACYAAEKPVADLRHESLSSVWNDDSKWGLWRSLHFQDLHECRECAWESACHICPARFMDCGLSVCSEEKRDRARTMFEGADAARRS